MSRPCILAIDQGTTSSRTIAFDAAPSIVCVAQQEFPQVYPAAGHVEHDAEAIWSSSMAVAREVSAVLRAPLRTKDDRAATTPLRGQCLHPRLPKTHRRRRACEGVPEPRRGC